MNHHSGPNDHDQAARHWLTQHQHALTHALDDLLDTEAGLREILLHSHHDTATDNLDSVLDTEAGLAAILPAPSAPPTDTHDTRPHHSDTTELLRALSAADRMTLRNNPDVKTASQALARDLDRTLARDLDRARTRARARDRALDLNRVLDLIVEVRTAEVGRAISLALRREPLVLNKDSLHALLDDFTATDLSNVDLAGIDLSGVHWSEHATQPPSTINAEDLKTRSDETPPGSGTWIVRSGTATIRDLAER